MLCFLSSLCTVIFYAVSCRHLDEAVVEGEGRDNGFVAFAALLELFDIQAAILVLVHHAKDFADALLGGVFVLGKLDHGADLRPC